MSSAVLEGSYDPGLVVLSLLIAISVSYVALDLAGRTAATQGRMRAVWLSGGSVSMGLGIWSMHYIGMLAFSLPVPVFYDLPTVLVSLLAAILASAVALLVVSRSNVSPAALLVGSFVMGGGIASMHYIGMAAMRMAAMHSYHVPTVILSIIIAVVVSLAALFISLRFRVETSQFSPSKLGGAAIMGFAIASMHYTGMAAVVFVPGSMHATTDSAVSISSLGTAAIAVGAIVSLVIVALLAIIDRRFMAQAAELRIIEERSRLLQIEKDAAEAASEAKTTFLATISHEIRTPMNALMGLQELLSLSHLSAEQQEWVRLMRQSSKDLLHLIDDVLDFSKIEAGKLDIGSEPTAIHELVQGVCDTFSVLARDKGLTLESSVAEGVPPIVMSDSFRLRQILSNLVSNAIKFTHQGKVHVRTLVSGTHADPRLEFQITDTGIGMTAEVVNRCGEPFQQADVGMARRYGGSGLGLAICKRLCSLMHGSLQIESIPGVGTRILVKLPMCKVTQPYEAYRPDSTQGLGLSRVVRTPEEAADNQRLIMVVDDHPTNRRLLAQQLEWLGYACESFGDARSALARFVERLSGEMPFAMTITDCQMPDMDGYELARQIRLAESGSSTRTVLVAFTADLSRSVADLTTSIGFDSVLSKPVDLTTLSTRLEQLLATPAKGQGSMPTRERIRGVPDSVSPLHSTTVQEEFRAAHEEDLEMLASGIQNKDMTLVARAAHRIRGAASMVGLHELTESAIALSRIVPSGDWSQIESGANQMRQTTQQAYQKFEQNAHAANLEARVEK